MSGLPSIRSHPACFCRGGFTRAGLTTVAALGFLLTSASTAAAQPAPPWQGGWEFRITSGGLVPTGAQRNALKDAWLTAAQASWVLGRPIAITATLAWARSRDLGYVGDPKLDVFTYDLGAEARAPHWLRSEALTFTPLVGLGAGARSYNHRSLDIDARHNVAGYAAVGGMLAMRRVELRVEVRDYVSRFRPLAGGAGADARNDIVVIAALSLRNRGG